MKNILLLITAIIFLFPSCESKSEKRRKILSKELIYKFDGKSIKGVNFHGDTLVVDGNQYLLPFLGKLRNDFPSDTIDAYILLEGKFILLNSEQKGSLALSLNLKLHEKKKHKLLIKKKRKELEDKQKEIEKKKKRAEQEKIDDILGL